MSLERLERLYASLELPRQEGNPCGTCKACCTAHEGFQHRISELELAYIAHKVSPEAATRMARYAAREEYDVCPHYQDGCTIYEHRPFSCRVFGHYREEGTRLPDGCVFTGRERAFARPDYYAIVPGARELRPLMREFSLLARGNPGPSDLSWLDSDDPVDQALMHLARQEYEPALERLLQAEGTPFVWHTLGLVYGLLDRNRDAVEAFRKSVVAIPDHLESLSQLGTSLMLVGELEEGMQLLQKVTELEPEHAAAHGLLGYGHILRREWTLAEQRLGKALELDPGNEFYRARLAQAASMRQ